MVRQLNLSRFAAITLVTMMLSACVSTPVQQTQPRIPPPAAGDSDDDAWIRHVLYQQHSEWAGTPYRFGGLDQSGIDCSGLVYKTFNEAFGLPLPRTTRGQVKIGEPVASGSLRAGDLLFFKTGGKTGRHVGIYVEDTRFLHASTSRGVVFSDLRNPYWASAYWQARRINGIR